MSESGNGRTTRSAREIRDAIRREHDARAAFYAECFSSFRRFCGLLEIQPKEGGGRIPFILSPTQRLYSQSRSARDIILKGRQVHMTTVEAARDLWWFLTKPGARVVIVCQSQSEHQALNDISYKIRLFIDALRRNGIALKFGTESRSEWTLPDRDSTMRLIEAGASEAAAEKKGRGGTVNRLHISECAVYEYADETLNALVESVSRVDSEIVIESTPKGASGYYYEQWLAAVSGRSGFKPHFFPWWIHPEYRMPAGADFQPETEREQRLLEKGVPAEALAWYRWKLREKGPLARLTKQEYPDDPRTCFLVSGRTFFDMDVLEKMIAFLRDPLTIHEIKASGARGSVVGETEVPAVRIWHKPLAGRPYVIGVDTSSGQDGDAAAAIVLERGSGRHMATLWGQFKPWELGHHLIPLARTFNNAEIAVERIGFGGTALQALEVKGYRNVYRDHDDDPGWINSEPSRDFALTRLEQAHRGGHFVTLDQFLAGEMQTFVFNKKGKPEASPGSHDDLVMAAAIGWDVICRPMRQSSGGGSMPIA